MLNLSNWLRKRSKPGQTAAKLYGSIVAQARLPVFYSSLGVADTTEGRYEGLALHLAVVLLALRRIEGPDGPIGRLLTEAFIVDMDDSMRELAVGDMSVPRKVKKAAAGLMERTLTYKEALDAADEAALRQCVSMFFGSDPEARATTALTRYVRSLHSDLDNATAAAELQTGNVIFPEPVTEPI
ncbi:MAG: ubiquinol-cytochrome C chaperone family protein [Hyphomicrobiaceae bacterium]